MAIDLAGGRPGLVGEVAVQLDEQRDEVDVGLDALEQFGFEQQLAQIEPLDGVALEDLDDRGREVPADVAEPPDHRRAWSARARPNDHPVAVMQLRLSSVAVVQRTERGVDPDVVAGQHRRGSAGIAADANTVIRR